MESGLLGSGGDIETKGSPFGKHGLYQGCCNVEVMAGEKPKPMWDCWSSTIFKIGVLAVVCYPRISNYSKKWHKLIQNFKKQNKP